LEKYTENLEQLVQDRTMELGMKAEDRSRKLAIVNNISQLISSNVGLEEILQQVVAIMGRVLRATQCSLMFIEKNGVHVRSKYEYRQGKPKTELIDIRISLERYPEVKKALSTRRPVVVNDVQRDPLMHEVRDLLGKLGIRSILVLPLMREGKVLGLLILRWRKKAHMLKLKEIHLGEIMASQISLLPSRIRC
jgi:two-component system sensor histidine kinase ChiS